MSDLWSSLSSLGVTVPAVAKKYVALALVAHHIDDFWTYRDAKQYDCAVNSIKDIHEVIDGVDDRIAVAIMETLGEEIYRAEAAVVWQAMD